MLSRLLSLLLLLPSLALAQDGFRSTPLGVQAATCAVGPGSVPYTHVQWYAVQFRPGLFLPEASLMLRCPITAHGTAYWTVMEVSFKDPDGFGEGSRVIATLWRQRRLFSPEGLARFDSSSTTFPSRHVSGWRSGAVPITVPQFDFGQALYWVDIQLIRRTATTVSPAIAQVWLIARDLVAD